MTISCQHGPWGARFRPLLLSALTMAALLLCGCPRETRRPEIVGVMYHQWWVPGRWVDTPVNHAYEPLLGHYDNADPGVIRQHIAWAKQCGVTTFVLDFWLTDHDWGWCERNTRAVLDICDEEGITYFFLADGWFTFADAADQAAEIAWRFNERAAPFFHRPNYLKVGGKPVVFFWASGDTDPAFWGRVRGGIEAAAGPVFLAGEQWDGFDLNMIYNPYQSNRATPEEQLAWQADLWKRRSEERKPWAPTASPGYDDHFVRDGNPPVPLDPEHFRQSLRHALRHNQHHADFQRWLFICSWSEWHEGSQIEPSAGFEDPEIFLKVLRQELDALD